MPAANNRAVIGCFWVSAPQQYPRVTCTAEISRCAYYGLRFTLTPTLTSTLKANPKCRSHLDWLGHDWGCQRSRRRRTGNVGQALAARRARSNVLLLLRRGAGACVISGKLHGSCCGSFLRLFSSRRLGRLGRHGVRLPGLLGQLPQAREGQCPDLQ